MDDIVEDSTKPVSKRVKSWVVVYLFFESGVSFMAVV